MNRTAVSCVESSMRQSHQPIAIPRRTIALFLGVCGIILLTFCLWGDALDTVTKEAVRAADGSRLQIALILFAVLASDILLPIPSCLASTLCGVLLGPWLGFSVSFSAMSASAAAGYWIGRRAGGRARRLIGESEFHALAAIHRRGGVWLLLGLRPVPILAEASLVFAGLAKVPVRKTVPLVALGNALVSAVYTALGAWFSTETEHVSLAFLLCLAASGLCMLTRPHARGW